jgi:ABC-type polysaccharide/polyol phosphate transport system ATPase subunit
MPLLSVQNLGKAYTLYRKPQDRLYEVLFGRWRHRSWGHRFWALRGLSFELCPGEMLGLIGRNGSGKSTALQMIAGVLKPTEGQIEIRGKLSALLELGSGFNPEFTGRENVFMSAALMGLSRQETLQKLDDVLSFADIGPMVDEPVKYYSSGMVVRLGFAVRVVLQPDILIVDEALAVGDVFFRQKCYSYLEKLRAKGTAVILVTHNMQEVEQFCDRAIVLERGEVYFEGTPAQAVRKYYILEQDRSQGAPPDGEPNVRDGNVSDYSPVSADDNWPGHLLQPVDAARQVTNGMAHCLGVGVSDLSGTPRTSFLQGETVVFWYEFEALDDLRAPVGGMMLKDQRNILVHGKNGFNFDLDFPQGVARGSRLRYRQEITMKVQPGEYSFDIGLADVPFSAIEQRSFLPPPLLQADLRHLAYVEQAGVFTIALPSERKPVTFTHYGLCDLPGRQDVEIIPAQ